jgi:hypothetical protein
METVSCYCCPMGNITPKSFAHQHHKIPQAAGGTDKDLVWLCAGCHAYTHSIAYMILNPKRTKDVSSALLFFKDPLQQKRIAELANLVAQEMAMKADGLKDLEDLEKPVSFTLRKEDYLKLMFAAKDSRISISDFAKQAVLTLLTKLY